MPGYCFGSFGLIRGYGALFKSYQEADASVFADARQQRKKGGSSDRNAVVVSMETGLCFWLDGDEDDIREEDLIPVRTADRAQARYSMDEIRRCEALWNGPREVAGFA